MPDFLFKDAKPNGTKPMPCFAWEVRCQAFSAAAAINHAKRRFLRKGKTPFEERILHGPDIVPARVFESFP